MSDTIEITLSENYANQFYTTLKGTVVKKDEYTTYIPESDREIESAINQGILIIKDEEEIEKKIEDKAVEEKIIKGETKTETTETEKSVEDSKPEEGLKVSEENKQENENDKPSMDKDNKPQNL